MDELGGCLFELVMKTVTTKVGCFILIIMAIVGGWLVYRELRAGGGDKPTPYDESSAAPSVGWRVIIDF